MNLHIVPDNTFINRFYENLEELDLVAGNRLVVRTNEHMLRSIRYDLPFAPLYSSAFNDLVGDTKQYKTVFIHYFTPLLYRWVACHDFNELNWMIWGGDLYNLPVFDHLCYEPITKKKYVDRHTTIQSLLLSLKLKFTSAPFERRAYSKVGSVLTWMSEEHQFAVKNLPVQADHKFFFYENQSPYQEVADGGPVIQREKPLLMIGNSGSPANNHLDAVAFLETNGIAADLVIPVSYGDQHYIKFLRSNLKYTLGDVQFLDRYMPFNEYVEFLKSTDGLIMNTIRPQGYGNILMMKRLGKPVFFNEKNISLPDLDAAGIPWAPVSSLLSFKRNLFSERAMVTDVFSHARLLGAYAQLFR